MGSKKQQSKKTTTAVVAVGGKRERDEVVEVETTPVVAAAPRVVLSLADAFASRKKPMKTKTDPVPQEKKRKNEAAVDVSGISSPVVAKAIVAYTANCRAVEPSAATEEENKKKGRNADGGPWFAWSAPAVRGKSTRTRMDRFNFPGCEELNEFVLKNTAGAKLFTGQVSCSDHRVLTPLGIVKKKGTTPEGGGTINGVPRAVKYMNRGGPVLLDRGPFNLVKNFVHPLHNFLQKNNGLHNEDEIQVLVVPSSDSNNTGKKKRKSSSSVVDGRDCFIATNQETLTQEALDTAVAGWGLLEALRIVNLYVIHGEKGRHAEQKLIDFYMSTHKKKEWEAMGRKDRYHRHDGNHSAKSGEDEVAAPAADAGWDHSPFVQFKGTPSTAADSPILVGERLPCVACRLYAAMSGADRHIAMLPTHGHLYVSTFEHTPTCVTSLSPQAALEVLNGGI